MLSYFCLVVPHLPNSRFPEDILGEMGHFYYLGSGTFYALGEGTLYSLGNGTFYPLGTILSSGNRTTYPLGNILWESGIGESVFNLLSYLWSVRRWSCKGQGWRQRGSQGSSAHQSTRPQTVHSFPKCTIVYHLISLQLILLPPRESPRVFQNSRRDSRGGNNIHL